MAISIVLAGVTFEIDGELTPAEDRFIRRATTHGPAEKDPATYHVSVCQVEGFDKRVDLSIALKPKGNGFSFENESFHGEADPYRRHTTLHRTGEAPFAIHVALRYSLNALLPTRNAIALHAAGVALEERGFIFFGPSGAGKSTLCATAADAAILSDELVAIGNDVDGFSLQSTGFWGNSQLRQWTATTFPLAAIIELAKGREFHLEPLSAREATRSLLHSIMTPTIASLWQKSLDLTETLVRQVPAYRMYWHPSDPPWSRLKALIPR